MTATNRLCGAGAGSTALAAAAMLVLAWPTLAHSASAPTPSLSLRGLFGATPDDRAFQAPPIARFRAGDGGIFVLDRSVPNQVLMKFEDNVEVWVLDPHPGPRGDVNYRNDMGELVLRATRVGGLTLFTSDSPDGAPAALEGLAPVIRLPPVPTPTALLHDFAAASARASRAAQRLVTFEAEDVPLTATALFADAAKVTSEAFVQIAEDGEDGRRSISRYSKVEFGAGSAPDAAARGAVVRITIAPERGLAGRPSSHRIAAAIGRR